MRAFPTALALLIVLLLLFLAAARLDGSIPLQFLS